MTKVWKIRVSVLCVSEVGRKEQPLTPDSTEHKVNAYKSRSYKQQLAHKDDSE